MLLISLFLRKYINKTKVICTIVLVYVTVLFPVKSSEGIFTLKVAIESATFLKYQTYLSQDVCTNLPDVNKIQSDRAIVELRIICMIFKDAGYTLDIKLFPSPNYKRSIRMIENGQVDIIAQTIWASEDNFENTYLSKHLIRSGEFEKGIYTRVDHHIHRVPLSELDLSKYVGLSFEAWTYDWEIMQQITPNIVSTHQVSSYLSMLEGGRADFIFMEFPSTDTLHVKTSIGSVVTPVEGIKVVINHPRSFLVSSAHEYSEVMLKVLNLGIDKFHEDGIIQQLYLDAGIFSSKAKAWKILNTVESKQ